MDKSCVKIVSNKESGALSFFYMNEKGQWRPVSNSSKLSRREITLSQIQESAERILTIIDQNYNINGCGVLVYFDGSDDDYICLQNCVKDCFGCIDRDIVIRQMGKNVVVSGKTGVGKTTFIEQMCQWLGGHYEIDHLEDYTKYSSETSKITWYETRGIEPEIGVDGVMDALDKFTENGLTDFLYCIRATHNRLEAIEEDLIINIRKNYPSVKVIILLTLAVSDDYSEIWVERLNKQFEEITVIPILAKDVGLRHGFVVESYGLDVVSRYLFGVDAYE